MLHRVENASGVFGSTETHSRGISVPHLRLQLLEEVLDDDQLARLGAQNKGIGWGPGCLIIIALFGVFAIINRNEDYSHRMT